MPERRPGRAEFEPSLENLREAVRAACAGQTDWQAKVAAGVAATLDFAAADPDAAAAITIDPRWGMGGLGNPKIDEVIAYFAAMLEKVAPAERHSPVSSHGLVEAIATAIRGHLLSGSVDQLPAEAPDFAYLTLMSYTGLAEARRWSERLRESREGGA